MKFYSNAQIGDMKKRAGELREMNYDSMPEQDRLARKIELTFLTARIICHGQNAQINDLLLFYD